MDYRQQMLNKYAKMYYDYAMAEKLKQQEEIERQKKLNRKKFIGTETKNTQSVLLLFATVQLQS